MFFEPSKIYNIYKPAGPTSFDIVRKVKSELWQNHGKTKIGHAGTLDPFADGVLVVATGNETKKIRFIQEKPKTYTAKVKLGISTDTLDPTGEILYENENWKNLTKDDLEKALGKFLGDIIQTTPKYSAVKIGGRKSYNLARSGQKFVSPKRVVSIYNLKLISFDLPFFEIEVECSTGTYIRTLGEDIAKSLGQLGTVWELTRTAVGDYKIDGSIHL